MFKLYKRLNLKDIIYVVLIIGLTILAVFFTMQLVDGIQDIITNITYVNYHNNPDEILSYSPTFKAIYEQGGWDAIRALASQMGESGETIIKVCDASVSDIWRSGAFILLYAVGYMAANIVIAILASYVAADLTTKIRSEFYKKIDSFSLEEINKFQTASLVTRSTNDLQQIQLANLMTMRMIFQAPVTCIWAIIKFQNASSSLSIATIVGIFAIIICVGLIMVLALPKFKVMQKLTDNLNMVTRDNLTGIRIVRAYNAEEYEEEKFKKANDEFTNANLFAGYAMTFMSPVMMIIMNGLSLAIYIIGANLINNGTLDYASVVSSVMLSSQIIMSFMMILMLFIMWPRAIVAAGRINEVLETEPKIKDPENPKEFIQPSTLEFKNVSFKYPGDAKDIVSDISFKIEKGETLAIIGATSSGKTTIVNMISRLYDASSGEVLVDGVNVKDVTLNNLRDKIGFVPQQGYLFNTTISSNISFGDLNKDLDKVKKAAEVSCASDFIEKLENNYEYQISEGGKNVSGGQRQRLCIARAVYKNPEIYVFDDSFSALDYETDKKLRQNLNEYAKDSTKVIVAQRIGTIMDADKILVLDEGRVVGYGKHKELLETCDVYKEIALSQLSREELGL